MWLMIGFDLSTYVGGVLWVLFDSLVTIWGLVGLSLGLWG